jgi:F0F1-type ATP synthase assembly protein I
LAITVLIGAYGGYRLDRWMDWSPWGTIFGSVLGVAAGLHGFIRRTMNK